MKKVIELLSVLVILFLPIILYVYNFGYIFSHSHQKWAEFGSLMSGIYSPIFAFFALLILIGQTRSQNAMHKHQYDQAYIQDTRNEINFYIQKLEKYLNEKYDESCSVGEHLNENYSKAQNSTLRQQEIIKNAKNLNKNHPHLFGIWLAIYPLLDGLNSQKEEPYMNSFIGAKSRLVTCLKYGTCVALDNLSYTITNDRNNGRYYFKDMK